MNVSFSTDKFYAQGMANQILQTDTTEKADSNQASDPFKSSSFQQPHKSHPKYILISAKNYKPHDSDASNSQPSIMKIENQMQLKGKLPQTDLDGSVDSPQEVEVENENPDDPLEMSNPKYSGSERQNTLINKDEATRKEVPVEMVNSESDESNGENKLLTKDEAGRKEKDGENEALRSRDEKAKFETLVKSMIKYAEEAVRQTIQPGNGNQTTLALAERATSGQPKAHTGVNSTQEIHPEKELSTLVPSVSQAGSEPPPVLEKFIESLVKKDVLDTENQAPSDAMKSESQVPSAYLDLEHQLPSGNKLPSDALKSEHQLPSENQLFPDTLISEHQPHLDVSARQSPIRDFTQESGERTHQVAPVINLNEKSQIADPQPAQLAPNADLSERAHNMRVLNYEQEALSGNPLKETQDDVPRSELYPQIRAPFNSQAQFLRSRAGLNNEPMDNGIEEIPGSKVVVGPHALSVFQLFMAALLIGTVVGLVTSLTWGYCFYTWVSKQPYLAGQAL